MSTLLANSDLKRRYEEVHKSIGLAKKELNKSLKRSAGIGEKSREDIDPIIEAVFTDTYYDALVAIASELSETKETSLSDANYKILFDPKVLQLLADTTVGELVDDFARKYDEITESSPILRRDFQYHNVTEIQQQLETNNFFGAGHTISLADENTQEKQEFSSDQSFRDMIEAEKLRVLGDEGIKKKFEAFNAKLKNKELQAFRDYITENKHLLPKLKDMKAFKRELWVQYLLKAGDEYRGLVAEYKVGKVELSRIVSDAEASRGDWDNVIAEFNRRFLYLPFELFVENKADAILKGSPPSVRFIFRSAGDKKIYTQTQKRDLISVLSTGEARALYILDIMYEFHIRWKARKKTLFVFDDVADSFDYKNKYAIIDFLGDVTKSDDINFLAIILTHNFDFFRTVASRKICPAHQCRLAYKSDDGVKLVAFKQSDILSPFENWRSKLDDPTVRVAFIPFLRNVIEYTQGRKNTDKTENADYMTLTRMVHYKDETEHLTMADYKGVFLRTFPTGQFPEIAEDQSIFEYILNTADDCQNADDGINLEHKIALSMATRIRAERYMVHKIRSNEPGYDTSKKQTGDLFQAFKEQFNNQIDEINLLRRVNLITPANIHINAFMYEPILDMGFGELVTLYQEVRNSLV